MRLVLLGPPGSGKGTQAIFIEEYFKIPKISTGDMLRLAIKNNEPLGLTAKEVMDSGKLLPDEIIIQLINNRLIQLDCSNGYLLDGFPRNIAQANSLKSSGFELDYVIEIVVPEKDIVERISGRRVHPMSGRSYHVIFNPPIIDGKDNITGDLLIQRNDDREEIVRNRLKIYIQQTRPLIDYYLDLTNNKKIPNLKYRRISGSGSVEEVRNRLFSAIN